MIVGILLWCFVLGLTLVGTYLLARQKKETKKKIHREPISVLKPLKGLDPGIEQNLRSFFELEYPEFEIFFCVDSEKDPVLKIIERLKEDYPNVKNHVVISRNPVGINPKINNLIEAYQLASYDCILISDSNIRVSRGYLDDVMEDLDSNVGVVTAIVSGVEATNFAAVLEANYLNTFYARWMKLSSHLGFEFVVGKSMLIRKKVCERFGGLKALGQYIAEDYMTGLAIKKLGLKVKIMNKPIQQFIGHYPFSTFWSRHLRWGIIRKSQAPLAFLCEPFVNAYFSGVIGAFALQYYFNLPGWILFVLHCSLWCALDLYLIKKFQSKITLSTVLCWFLKESFALIFWTSALLKNHVYWRGRRLRIYPGGLVSY